MSRSDKKQPGALVGEKSQAVYSANWKLDAVLHKELQMLDTSKHRVTHRISLNQRVVNMRFQQKLHRSKIFHARMTGNTEMLRDLLRHDNYNFKLSRNDSETLPPAYLRNLRARSAPPTRAPTSSPTREENRKTSKAPMRSKSAKFKKFGMTPPATPLKFSDNKSHNIDANEDSHDEIQDAAVKKIADENQQTGTEEYFGSKGNMKSETSEEPASDKVASRIDDDVPRLTHAMRKATLSATVRSPTKPTEIYARPKTALGTMPITEVNGQDTEQNAIDDQIESNDPLQGPSSPHDKLAQNIETTADPHGSVLGPSVGVEKTVEHMAEENQSTDINPSNMSSNKRTADAVSFRSTAMVALLGATLEHQFMKGKQSEAANNNKHSMPSIFGEEKKPTILELNTVRIRKANYPGRVKEFVANMDSYTDPENVDYYALRLAENAGVRSRQRGNSFSKSETVLKAERDLATRSEGNLKAKNMTFRSVTKPL